jgi:transcriptional regulator with XRE-family HTH domain
MPLSDFVPRQHSPDRGRPPIGARGTEWAQVVGRRVRELRRGRGWTIFDLAGYARRADGLQYSPSTFSRLERGSAASPFHVFLQLASVLEIAPGRLLGEDEALLDATGGETTLLRTLRELGIAPHEALALILQARSTAMRSSSPSM